MMTPQVSNAATFAALGSSPLGIRPAAVTSSPKEPQRIRAYAVESLGVEHPQYFQGVGVSCTDWAAVYVGTGDDAAEAYADALEHLATDGEYDAYRLPKHPKGIRKTDSVRSYFRSLGETYDEGTELLHYVAIYVR